LINHTAFVIWTSDMVVFIKLWHKLSTLPQSDTVLPINAWTSTTQRGWLRHNALFHRSHADAVIYHTPSSRLYGGGSSVVEGSYVGSLRKVKQPVYVAAWLTSHRRWRDTRTRFLARSTRWWFSNFPGKRSRPATIISSRRVKIATCSDWRSWSVFRDNLNASMQLTIAQ